MNSYVLKPTHSRQFRDNEPSPPARQLPDLRTNAHTSVLADHRPSAQPALQLKSKVTNKGQYYSWGYNKETLVGETMVAFLDPAYPLQGQSAALNSDQDDMMSWIKSQNNINAAGAVKGHLLNDNLGGSALNVNLFPITKAANAVHLRIAENEVKNRVWDDQIPTYYYVEAKIGSGKVDTFTGVIADWNMQNNKISNRRTFIVESHLKNPNDMEMANPDEDIYVKAEMSNAKAAQSGRAFKPHSKVGDLNQEWQDLRDRSHEINKLVHSN